MLTNFNQNVIFIEKPDGSYKTVGYSAGVEGYKTLPIDKISPFGLTPFPFDMGGENDKELQPISALTDLAKVWTLQTIAYSNLNSSR